MKSTVVQRLQLLRPLMSEVRLRWFVFAPVLAIWVLAATRLLVDATPRVPLLFNWTPSIPHLIAWLRPVPQELHRGDYIVYAFDGEAKRNHPGLHGQPFFKIVRGLPGDVIDVRGRVILINGEAVGIAKTHTRDRRSLEPLLPTVIPTGHYYVQGTSPDSFDSRYRSSGLVRFDQMIGVALPLW